MTGKFKSSANTAHSPKSQFYEEWSKLFLDTSSILFSFWNYKRISIRNTKTNQWINKRISSRR